MHTYGAGLNGFVGEGIATGELTDGGGCGVDAEGIGATLAT